MVTGKDKLTGKEIEHITEVTKSVWKNGKFANVFREIGVKVVRQLKRKKQQATKYFLMVAKNSTRTVVEKCDDNEMFVTLKTTYDLKTLKHTYRKLSKLFHPDMGGDENKFKLANVIYRIRKDVFESSISAFGYIDKDIADMTEQLTKEREEINY